MIAMTNNGQTEETNHIQTSSSDEAASDYELVAAVIHLLEETFQEQPSLEDLAAELHISPYHLQRVFTRWAGISPKRFLQYLTVEHAKALLEESSSVLETAFGAGLSGTGRLHDLFVTVEAVTPGEYKTQGEGLHIRYGRQATPFGDCLLATTDRGICHLSFLNGHGWENALADLQSGWPGAQLTPDPRETADLAEHIFRYQPDKELPPLRVLLQGTNFQIKVWEALLRVPAGALCSYSDVAHLIDRPRAARAVGSAVGANPVAYLIPCHRVIRQSGIVKDYRWGSTRKKAILGWEAAHRQQIDSQLPT